MKQLRILLLVIVSMTLLPSCQNNKSFGKIKINSDWKFFQLKDSSQSEDTFHEITFDDSNWKSVSLPHTANIEPLVVNDQWQGICWYRKKVNVPNFNEDKKVYFELEAAMNHSKIWVNGELLKVHLGGYLPIMIDISKYINKGSDNVIAIRLNNTDNPITGPKPLKILDFNMYGGLYRNAHLIIKENLHISHPLLANKTAGGGIFVTFPQVNKNTATSSFIGQ